MKFEEGKPRSCTLLGYRNVNGRFKTVPKEAERARMLFTHKKFTMDCLLLFVYPHIIKR